MDNSSQNRRFIIILLLLLFFGTAIFSGATVYLIIKDKNSPQKQLNKAVQEYKAINFRITVPNRNWDTLESVRNILTNRAIKAQKELESGNKSQAESELTTLKKRIELQSRGDNDVAKVSQGKVPDIDKNGDGISDYLESFYKVVLNVIKQLQ